MIPDQHEPLEPQAGTVNGRRLGVVDGVYVALRDAINSGRIAPGEVLSQVQLARQFGVSRTPLREAVRMLQAEGLLVAVPNQRVCVAPISVAELEQLYTIRIAAEAVALRVSVPRFSDEDFAKLHGLVRRLEKCAESGDVDGWEDPHQEFHRRLVSHAGVRAVAVIEGLQRDANRYRRFYVTRGPGAWLNTTTEHAAILRCCEQRDPVAAAAELARHYARAALTVIALVDPGYDPVGVRTAVGMVIPGQGSEVPIRPVAHLAESVTND